MSKEQTVEIQEDEDEVRGQIHQPSTSGSKAMQEVSQASTSKTVNIIFSSKM